MCLVMLLMAWGSGMVMGQGRERGSPRGFEAYEVVVDQNMFLRERGRRVEPAPQVREVEEERAPAAAPARPEEWHVLRGLVFEGEEPLAFFENTQEGVTRAYRQGDVLVSGRIGAITLSGVEYVAGEERVRVGLGEDLRGIRSTMAVGSVVSGEAPDGEEAESPRPTGNLSAIEQRMRQRRMQEGGGR